MSDQEYTAGSLLTTRKPSNAGARCGVEHPTLKYRWRDVHRNDCTEVLERGKGWYTRRNISEICPSYYSRLDTLQPNDCIDLGLALGETLPVSAFDTE